MYIPRKHVLAFLCSGYHICFTRKRSRFDPQGNLLPYFCHMYVELEASVYYIDQEKDV